MESFEFDEEEFVADLGLQIKVAMDNAELFGASESEKLQIKINVLKSYTLNFLEQIREYIENLSNRSLAVVLLMLIDLGIEFENEEEILFWINKIERIALDRLELYALPGASRFLDAEKKSGLLSIISVLQKKNPENLSFLTQLQKAFEITKPSFSNDNTDEDSLALLQTKLSSAGVEIGEKRWHDVIAKYNLAIDKNGFVNNWSPNSDDIQFINLQKQNIELKNKKNLYQKEKQQQELYKKKTEQENILAREKEKAKKKNKNLVYREFSDKKLQKKVLKTAEKENKQLKEKDIKKIKLKLSENKSR